MSVAETKLDCSVTFPYNSVSAKVPIIYKIFKRHSSGWIATIIQQSHLATDSGTNGIFEEIPLTLLALGWGHLRSLAFTQIPSIVQRRIESYQICFSHAACQFPPILFVKVYKDYPHITTSHCLQASQGENMIIRLYSIQCAPAARTKNVARVLGKTVFSSM